MGYQKNTWTVYDKTTPDYKQPDSFITKKKLDNIEGGIAAAITDLQLGEISKGLDVKCEIITDENDPTIKRINLVVPREVSWHFSSQELHDNAIAPSNVYPNDIILDTKGNLFFVITNDSNEYRLDLQMNIKGSQGISGHTGPQGLPGLNGENGLDGKDGNRWIYIDTNLIEGDNVSSKANYQDLILDIQGNVFEVLEDLTVHYLINIKGQAGKDGDMYQLEIGEVTIGDTASAEIVNNKLNLTIPKGDPGLSGTNGKSAYQTWLDLGNEGTEEDFINSLIVYQTKVVNDINISTDDWVTNQDGFCEAIVVDTDVTSKNVVNLNFHYSTTSSVIQNDIKSYTSPFDGGFKVFAKSLPSSDIVINYCIL